MIAVRSNHLGGMASSKWHLVRERSDHVALCGRAHTCVGPFSNSLTATALDWARTNGYVCKRCAAREPPPAARTMEGTMSAPKIDPSERDDALEEIPQEFVDPQRITYEDAPDSTEPVPTAPPSQQP
jgi:hypothetical protein